MIDMATLNRLDAALAARHVEGGATCVVAADDLRALLRSFVSRMNLGFIGPEVAGRLEAGMSTHAFISASPLSGEDIPIYRF